MALVPGPLVTAAAKCHTAEASGQASEREAVEGQMERAHTVCPFRGQRLITLWLCQWLPDNFSRQAHIKVIKAEKITHILLLQIPALCRTPAHACTHSRMHTQPRKDRFSIFASALASHAFSPDMQGVKIKAETHSSILLVNVKEHTIIFTTVIA